MRPHRGGRDGTGGGVVALLLVGLDPAAQPEAADLKVLTGLELDPGRPQHGPVALPGRVHGQGGQLLGERHLVVGEALPVARRQLVGVHVGHIDPVHPDRPPVLDLPDQALAELHRLHGECLAHLGRKEEAHRCYLSALAVAREQEEEEVPLSIRSGGHGISGRSTNDGGIVIDHAKLDHYETVRKGSEEPAV